MDSVETLIKDAYARLQLIDPSHPELRFIQVLQGNIVWSNDYWREYTSRFSQENGKMLSVQEELGKYHAALRTAIRACQQA